MSAVESKPSVRILALVGILIAATWTAHIVLRQFFPPGHSVRLLASAAVIVAFACFVAAQVHLARSLDEFQRQVQLFALAVAFPASLVTAVAVGFLRAEGFFAGADPRDLPFLMLLFYGLGLALAWRRYR